MTNLPKHINLNKYLLGKTFRKLPYHFRSYIGRAIGVERESYGFHYSAGEFKYNGWKEPFRVSHTAKQISNQRRRRWEQRAFHKLLRELDKESA